MKKQLPLALCLLLLAAGPTMARQKKNKDLPLPDMYIGEVQRVIDGDTVIIKVQLWPTLTSTLPVRIRGIDTPESRDHCLGAQKMRQQATAFVKEKLKKGERVRLTKIGKDKYGRGLARIRYRARENYWMKLEKQMLKRHLACKYTGNTKRKWCKDGKFSPCWNQSPAPIIRSKDGIKTP